MAVEFNLQNKVAVVSGGSRGIGAACVRMFVEAGAKVVFNYQKDRKAADELVRSLGPDVCYSVQADLASADALLRGAEKVQDAPPPTRTLTPALWSVDCRSPGTISAGAEAALDLTAGQAEQSWPSGGRDVS